jgi:hypothetical protein
MAVYYNNSISYTEISKLTSGSGWYNIRFGVETIPVYIDQSYSGGGWCLVLANRGSTGGMNNLTHHDAVHNANYRTGGSNQGSNIRCRPNSNNPGLALSNYNVWIGTKYWNFLSGRLTSGKITIVQFVSTTNGTALSATGSHTKRYRWQANHFTNGFYWSGATAISDETTTGAPGFYSYHAANSFGLTCYDYDVDTYGSNCSTLYNNNPWWYGNCWSGNYFAGNGYADAPYWDGSGGDYHQYGAVYIK